MSSIMLLIAALLAACSPASVPEPSAIATNTPALSPPVATQAAILAPTLPPEWTPTDTFTPTPPSPTRTATPTPSITPTLDAEGLCAAFELALQPRRTAISSLSLAWNYPLADAAVRLRILHQDGELFIITVPGPNAALLQLPFAPLSGIGHYDWTLTPLTPEGDPLAGCAVSGHVLAVWPWSEFLPWAQF